VVIGMVTLSTVAAREVPGTFQVADGVAIYLGVMSAHIAQGHVREHEASKMHVCVPNA